MRVKFLSRASHLCSLRYIWTVLLHISMWKISKSDWKFESKIMKKLCFKRSKGVYEVRSIFWKNGRHSKTFFHLFVFLVCESSHRLLWKKSCVFLRFFWSQQGHFEGAVKGENSCTNLSDEEIISLLINLNLQRALLSWDIFSFLWFLGTMRKFFKVFKTNQNF